MIVILKIGLMGLAVWRHAVSSAVDVVIGGLDDVSQVRIAAICLVRAVVIGDRFADGLGQLPAFQNRAGNFGVRDSDRFEFAILHRVAAGRVQVVYPLEFGRQGHGNQQLADIVQQSGRKGALGIRHAHFEHHQIG